MGAPESRFDQDYYDRFYRDPASRVTEAEEMERLVGFVASYAKYLEIPVRSAVDLGCGLGPWQAPLKRCFPRLRYQGVELSRHLCRELGWREGSVVDWAGKPADLVICHGVLQYLGARDAKRAIANLHRLTRGLLYLQVLTTEDWEDNCDRARTDGDVNLRPASWYHEALSGRFVAMGGGVFLPAGSDVVLYELERPF